MIKLSTPMLEALNAAYYQGRLHSWFGCWGPESAGVATWIQDKTIQALHTRGLLRKGGRYIIITEEGIDALNDSGWTVL